MRSGSVVKKTVISGMLLLLLAALCFAACGEPARDGDSSELDPEFLDGVERADEDGYEVYWLGREFAVNGATFRGPSVASFANEVQGGGLDLGYFATVDPETKGAVVLQIVLYSARGWELAKEQTLNPRESGATEKEVTIQGAKGTLILIPAGTRPVNQALLIWNQGETVVSARAYSGGPLVPGGPDSNPLIDPDTLLAVLENLRPYPE